MSNGAYHIVVIAVAVWGIVTGYRKGIFRLSGAMLAVAFAIVVVRMVSDFCFESVEKLLPGFISGFQRSFVVQTLTCGIIYVAVVWLIELLTFPLNHIMKFFGNGVISSITGAVFRVFQYLMLLSLAYNLIVDLDSTGTLARTARMHDGNVVEGVIMLAPTILDFPGGEEVGHRQQLEDAKKIS